MSIQSALQEITFTVTIKQMCLLSIFTWRWTPEQINLYVDAFIPEIFITTEQTTTSFLKKKFLQFSIVRLHQCPLFNSNTAVKQGDKMYTDLINQEKIRHISVIIRGSP